MKFCSPLTVLKQPCFAWDCEALMEAGKAAKGSEIISVFWGETSGSIRNQKDQEKKKKVHSKGIIYSDHAMCSKALIDIKEMQALGLGMDLGFNSSLMYHFHVSVHLHLTGVAQPCICGGELEGMSCMRSALLSTDTDQHNTEEAGASGLQGCHLVTSILSSTGSCAKNNLASPED